MRKAHLWPESQREELARLVKQNPGNLTRAFETFAAKNKMTYSAVSGHYYRHIKPYFAFYAVKSDVTCTEPNVKNERRSVTAPSPKRKGRPRKIENANISVSKKENKSELLFETTKIFFKKLSIAQQLELINQCL
jgi:hypothetical protein